MSVVTSTPFIICLAILGAVIFAIVILDIAGYVPQARELLARQQDEGRHAVKGKRSHVKTGPESPDPFAHLDDPKSSSEEEAADRYVAALRAGDEPGHAADVTARFEAALRAEGLDEPAAALSAPVPAPDGEPGPETVLPVAADLEPLPGPPPLEVRTRSAAIIAAPWEPPVSRGDLSSLRDALRAWTPAPAVPQEPQAAPVPVPPPLPDWLTATGEMAFAPVMELGDVDGYLDRVFGPAEEALGAAVAEHLGGDGKGEFLGTSLPGLPEEDWDFTRPVLALPGGTVAGTSTEAGAA